MYSINQVCRQHRHDACQINKYQLYQIQIDQIPIDQVPIRSNERWCLSYYHHSSGDPTATKKFTAGVASVKNASVAIYSFK